MRFSYSLKDDFSKIVLSPWVGPFRGGSVCPDSFQHLTSAPVYRVLIYKEMVKITCLLWVGRAVLQPGLQNPGLKNFRGRALGAQ